MQTYFKFLLDGDFSRRGSALQPLMTSRAWKKITVTAYFPLKWITKPFYNYIKKFRLPTTYKETQKQPNQNERHNGPIFITEYTHNLFAKNVEAIEIKS